MWLRAISSAITSSRAKPRLEIAEVGDGLQRGVELVVHERLGLSRGLAAPLLLSERSHGRRERGT